MKSLAYKVLIIDDDSFLVDLYKAEYIKAGCTVESFLEAEGDIVKRVLEAAPDVITLDIIMPGRDGLEALALLKEDNRTKNIPVFIVSNQSSEEDINISLLGAVDHLIPGDHTAHGLTAHILNYLESHKDSKSHPKTEVFHKDNGKKEDVHIEQGSKSQVTKKEPKPIDDGGPSSLSLHLTNLGMIVTGVVGELKGRAERKGLSIIYEATTEEFPVFADAIRIKNVVRALIDNAICYTQHGSISVLVKRYEGVVRLAVKDTGVGIRKEDLEILFPKEAKPNKDGTQNLSNHGFSLLIAHRVIAAHHGRIWAESDGENKGSTFYVELPSSNPFGNN